MDTPTSQVSDAGVPALHQALVDKLKSLGSIRAPSVEAAFRAVPRHLFLPGVPLDRVYSDQAILTKRQDGRPISSSSQPAVMAIMLEQLGLEPGHRVLEIGAGTGYNAALMAWLVGEAGRVVAVDVDDDIVAGARAHLAAAGFDRVRVVCGDGALGYPDAAPYDRIILTVGAWDIAPAWIEQLQPGGRLLLPLAVGAVQRLVAFERAGDHLTSVSVTPGAFMRLRGAFAGPESVLPLGPEPGLLLEVTTGGPVDAAAIYRSLTGPSGDLSTGVRVAPQERWGSLTLWLALHEPDLCTLSGEGAIAAGELVPDLYGSPGYRASVGLLGERTLCLLARRADPPLDELAVRRFGPDVALAERLAARVAAWDAAGRPDHEGLRIRAYPRDTDLVPPERAFVVPKRWTRLVIDWQ